MGRIVSTDELFGKKKIVTTEELFGKQESPTVEKMKGVGEAALSLGSGALSWIPAGLSMFSFDKRSLPERAKTATEIQEALTYTPKTETGAKLVEPVAQLFENYGIAGREYARNIDNPYLATAVHTATEGIPFLVPFVGKGVKAGLGKTFRGVENVLEPTRETAPVVAQPKAARGKKVVTTEELDAVQEAPKAPPAQEIRPAETIQAPEATVFTGKVFHGGDIAADAPFQGLGLHASEDMAVAKAMSESGNVQSFSINNANLLKIRDFGGRHDNALFTVREMVKDGVLPRAWLNGLEERLVGDQAGWEARNIAELSRVKEYLKGKGYDGLIYENIAEGGEKPSIVMFDRPAKAIRPEDMTKGTPRGEIVEPGATSGAVRPPLAFDPMEELPVNRALSEIKSQGGLNIESLRGRYSQPQITELVKKRPGLVSKNGKATLDEMADMHGYESGDVLLQDILGAKSKKAYAEAKKADIDARYHDEMKQKVAVGELKEGDKVVIDGEEFKHTGYDAEGNAIIKDGETITADPFEILRVDKVKKAKFSESTQDIPGFSERETFSLTESPGMVGEKVIPKGSDTEGLFTAGIDPTKTKEVLGRIKEGITRPPKWGDFERLLNQVYGGTLQRKSIEMRRFGDELKAGVPSRDRRNALTNWIEAGGDETLLKQRAAESLANPKTKRFAKGYEDAARLSPQERAAGQKVINRLDEKLKEAQDAGILEGGVENYINHVWKRDNPATKKLLAEVAIGKLSTNPSLARKRILDTYFDGEQLGYEPITKDVGQLLVLYDRALSTAIAARDFVRGLADGKASDGRPLVHVAGSGTYTPKGQPPPERYMIRPRSTPEEVWDYKPIDHPALRKWKWVGADEAGKPILMQGDMYVHPEIYRHMKNVLGTSAVRQNRFGRAALSAVYNLKGALLSFSGFHQVQEGLHAVFHKVNPANAPKIDLNDPVQMKLVDHGLMISDYSGLQMFSEGLAQGGLVTKIPGIGRYMQMYSEYLFQDYIPRLKMKMGTEAYERNTERYKGKLTDDQIASLTADQSNAAFGELNYDKLGRNKTLQDILRLSLLAPDFLEARGRFVAQAATPFGKEQFVAAAVRGAAGLYVGARIANMILNDGDAKWDKPFSVVIGKNEYLLRSIPGDVYHLLSDPRSFVYYRLNPTTVRTAVEYVTSRDSRGQYRDIQDQIEDFFKTHIPIPFQQKQDNKWWASILQSMGVGVYRERSQLERTLSDLHSRRMVVTPIKGERDRLKLAREYATKYREVFESSGDPSQLAESLKADLQSGKIYEEDIERIFTMATGDRRESLVKNLPIEDVMEAWPKATEEEKALLLPLVVDKASSLLDNHPERFKKLIPEMRRVFGAQEKPTLTLKQMISAAH